MGYVPCVRVVWYGCAAVSRGRGSRIRQPLRLRGATVHVLGKYHPRPRQYVRTGAPVVTFGRIPPVDRVPLPRRAVFGLAISAPISFDDDDQDRTLHSLEVLGLGEEASSRLTDQPQSLVLQASGCTMCGVCVKACPHDALAIEPAKKIRRHAWQVPA